MPADALDERGAGMVGRVLDYRYQLEAELGSGAMGTVYWARHIALDRCVAVKVLHESLVRSPSALERFQREATAAAGLDHRNIVPVLDLFELADGRWAMVAELVTGRDLASWVGEPMPLERLVPLAIQICQGLQHAHSRGLVHRDLKPDNVMIDVDELRRERARIIDFGIASLRDPRNSDLFLSTRLTEVGTVIGTPAYMAPEHACGSKVNRRTDLFSLGIMLFELATGRLPFDGSGVETAMANVSRDLPPFRERCDLDIDPLFEAIVRKLAARNPADRFESAHAAACALELLTTDRDGLAAWLGVPRPIPAPLPHAVETISPHGANVPATVTPRRSRSSLRRSVVALGLALAGALTCTSGALP